MELTLSNFVVPVEPNSKRYLQFFLLYRFVELNSWHGRSTMLGTARRTSFEMQSLIMVTTDRAKINFRLLKHLYKTMNIITGK